MEVLLFKSTRWLEIPRPWRGRNKQQLNIHASLFLILAGRQSLVPADEAARLPRHFHQQTPPSLTSSSSVSCHHICTSFFLPGDNNGPRWAASLHSVEMAARSRPRAGQLKDEIDEERSLWNQIKADGRRFDQLMVRRHLIRTHCLIFNSVIVSW